VSFDLAFKQVVGLEGKFSDDETDPGNWTTGVVNTGELKGTMYGISAKSYPTLDIKNLTLPKVKDIYLRDFWNKIGGDLLPDIVSVALFKEAVNLGTHGAVTMLQKSLKIEPSDGVIGQITVGVATSHPPMLVLQQFLTECAYAYTKMALFQRDGKGWLSRVIKTALEGQLSDQELTPDAVKG